MLSQCALLDRGHLMMPMAAKDVHIDVRESEISHCYAADLDF